MQSDPDKELMEAVLRQIDGKINNQQLADDLGMNSAASAGQRWRRFKTKLLGDRGEKVSTTTSVVESLTSKPTKISTSTGSKREGKRPKKRKLISSDEEDEKLEIDEDADANRKKVVQEAASRTLPGRKARVMHFKKELSEDGEDDGQEAGEDFEEAGTGSGHGSLEETEALGDDCDWDEI